MQTETAKKYASAISLAPTNARTPSAGARPPPCAPHLAAAASVARAWAAEAMPLLYDRMTVHMTPWSISRALGSAPVTVSSMDQDSQDGGDISGDDGDSNDDDDDDDDGSGEFDRRWYCSFVPTTLEILALARRPASDFGNPLPYVRHLELVVSGSNDYLPDLLRAMSEAGAQLRHLSIAHLTITVRLLEALRPLVDATTSLVLDTYSIDKAARSPFLELFSGQLSQLDHDSSIDAGFVSSLVAANAKALKSFTYLSHFGVQTLPGFEGVATLESLSLDISATVAKPFLESILFGRCESLTRLVLTLYVTDDPALSLYYADETPGKETGILKSALALGPSLDFPKLQYLEIHTPVSTAVLAEIAIMCPEIRRLDMPATTESLEPLCQLKHLRLVVMDVRTPNTNALAASLQKAAEFVLSSSGQEPAAVPRILFACHWRLMKPQAFIAHLGAAEDVTLRTQRVVRFDDFHQDETPRLAFALQSRDEEILRAFDDLLD
ncbi:hypothetical protein HK405_008588 [Cladochytrium tenue]|nr:hypothetical protein HK405_008588 [Cladochytrium tenue]